MIPRLPIFRLSIIRIYLLLESFSAAPLQTITSAEFARWIYTNIRKIARIKINTLSAVDQGEYTATVRITKPSLKL